MGLDFTKMTLKQKLLAIKQSNSINPVQLGLVKWMLENEYVTAPRKKRGWGLYKLTYAPQPALTWEDYIL
jgi:hypothetical protein